MDINFEFAKAKRLFIVPSPSIALHLIGCGGTGSWLAPTVARLARLIKDRFHKDVHVVFWDPEKVEEENIYRQNFCFAEVGRYKAEALAGRYGLAWGIDITPRTKPFERHSGEDYARGSLKVLIGCVDNATARNEIAHCYRGWDSTPTLWWLDCGNGKAHGQVLFGAGTKPPADPFVLAGYCNWIPWPATRWPGILEDMPMSSKKDEEGLSCAVLAMKNDQGLAINQRIAAEAGDYLVRMLITGDLRKIETFIDLESGTTRSVYITEDSIAPGFEAESERDKGA